MGLTKNGSGRANRFFFVLFCAISAQVGASTASAVTVTVPASAGPWSQSLNPGFDYSVHDNTAPVVINASNGIGFTPGSTITVSYVSGGMRAAPDAPFVDANGQQGFPTNTYDGLHGRFPAFYMDRSVVVVYVGLRTSVPVSEEDQFKHLSGRPGRRH